MAKQKSRFPSYGLVRGPSHERGGVAGMVAGEQPVELEGGEWIIPKEAVPDYLPVLKQITNKGRAMQQMQNGNSAMDALIASATMEAGISEPKTPMFMGGGMTDEYEGGGQLHSRRMYNQEDKKKYGYEMGGMMPEYQDGGQVQRKTLRGSRRISSDLQNIDGKFQAQSIFGIPADQVGGEEGLRYYLSDPRISSNMSMAMSKAAFDARNKMAFSPEDSLPAALVEGYFDQLESPSPLENVKKKGFGFLNKLLGKNKEQGGKIDEYQDGGEIPIRRKNQPMGESDKKIGEILSALLKYNPVNMTAKTLQYAKDEDLLGQMMGNYPPSIKEQTAFDQRNKEIKERWGNPTLPGQMQPRKQQEIRNPQMYGPPDSLMGPDTTGEGFQQMLNQMIMRDVNQSINPLTGDSLDIEGDSLKLLQRMKKSKIPRARRKIMQQGGKIDYDVIGLESLENRFPNFDAPMSNPEFEAAMQYGERGMDLPQGSPEGSFMSSLGKDKRVRPSDSYTVQNGFMSKREIPKLSSAYMQSMGIETPLSRRQRSLLQRKAIAPQTLNPQVQSLLGRALVQRLANEPL